MNEKTTKKKDYIDEHEEWQKHQFDPGYFTGGHIPVWIKNPGSRKKLGSVFLAFGLFYGSWTTYNIIQLSKAEQNTEQVVSAIFLGLAAIIFLWAGIKLMKKSKKE